MTVAITKLTWTLLADTASKRFAEWMNIRPAQGVESKTGLDLIVNHSDPIHVDSFRYIS